MRIRNVMSHWPRSVAPTTSIADAASLMAMSDLGSLPVVDHRRIVGIITDRDLAVRGLAARLQGDVPVFRVMTREVVTCGQDDEFADVLRAMADRQIRRIPVCSAEGELIGMVSISDAARCGEYSGEAVETLAAIGQARSRYCQILERTARDVEPQEQLIGF